MEEGQLTDSFGRHVSFRNVVLIMTSNIGADLIKNKAGFGFTPTQQQEGADYKKMKQTLNAEIERHFRPEFINRLDDVIVFHSLTRQDLINIVDYELKKVFSRLHERGIALTFDQSAKDFLIEKGYNPDYGARPLRRAIEQYVEDPLSESLLKGEFDAGQHITVRREGEDGALQFSAEAQSEAASDADETGEHQGRPESTAEST
jgi:ATP-dependent Clp protease ATP-binding subunit ClpC